MMKRWPLAGCSGFSFHFEHQINGFLADAEAVRYLGHGDGRVLCAFSPGITCFGLFAPAETSPASCRSVHIRQSVPYCSGLNLGDFRLSAVFRKQIVEALGHQVVQGRIFFCMAGIFELIPHLFEENVR